MKKALEDIEKDWNNPIRMKINAATKISTLLKHDIRTMEAIISISSNFEKLRNPLLRRLLAGRTNIAMACRIAGCEVGDFYEKMKQLGFVPEDHNGASASPSMSLPAFLANCSPDNIQELDVRPILTSNADPLKIIMDLLKKLSANQVLKIINTFEPTPLIELLSKKGYDVFVKPFDSGLIETYISKSGMEQEHIVEGAETEDDWDAANNRFKDHLVQVDVRHLPMPKPMVTILEALEGLDLGKALFVIHKKTPVYLLPELREKGFDYRIRETDINEVQLLIFKEENESFSGR